MDGSEAAKAGTTATASETVEKSLGAFLQDIVVGMIRRPGIIAAAYDMAIPHFGGHPVRHEQS
jgi:hypothetical protein